MRRKTTWLAIAMALVAAILTTSAALAADRFQKLTGPQIRARIAGMEISDEVHWADTYEASGMVASSAMGKKRSGKWWIQDDQLCAEFEDSGDCFEVWVAGQKVQLRREGLDSSVEGVLRKPVSRP
jgi:hypothetical protein